MPDETGQPPVDFPPPLDLTDRQVGQPFLVRFGPGFEWQMVDGTMRLVVMFALPGGAVAWKGLTPDESRRLLEWMLASVTAAK